MRAFVRDLIAVTRLARGELSYDPPVDITTLRFCAAAWNYLPVTFRKAATSGSYSFAAADAAASSRDTCVSRALKAAPAVSRSIWPI
ncbi:hypothetical protein [Kribbella sp. NPDC023855]|uniref:hypothetical protein n=1 Tax=Kribbella sp. NPDC023855 TaxID=3154698 RepID=UPI00340FB92C